MVRCLKKHNVCIRVRPTNLAFSEPPNRSSTSSHSALQNITPQISYIPKPLTHTHIDTWVHTHTSPAAHHLVLTTRTRKHTKRGPVRHSSISQETRCQRNTIIRSLSISWAHCDGWWCPPVDPALATLCGVYTNEHAEYLAFLDDGSQILPSLKKKVWSFAIYWRRSS